MIRKPLLTLFFIVGICAALALLPVFYRLGNWISPFPWMIIKASDPRYTGTFWAEPEQSILSILNWYWSIAGPFCAWLLVFGVFLAFTSCDNKKDSAGIAGMIGFMGGFLLCCGYFLAWGFTHLASVIAMAVFPYLIFGFIAACIPGVITAGIGLLIWCIGTLLGLRPIDITERLQ